jgi:hypothetical protein
VAALLTAVRFPAPGLQSDRLASLLDVERLRLWGWDAVTNILTVDAAQPILGFAKCAVAECDCESSSADKLCTGCAHRWREAGGDWEQFVAAPLSRQRYRTERLCLVCRTPGHQRPATRRGLCLACAGLRTGRHQTVEAYVRGDERFGPAAPRPTLGFCTVPACDRLAAFSYGLCAGHQTRWARAGRPELRAWCATVDPLLGDRGGRIALAGLPEAVVVEFLFGVQTSVDAGVRRRLSDLRAVARLARRLKCSSLAELVGAPMNSSSRRFLAHTLDAIELAAKSPESECRLDKWDLRVWGFGGVLSFVGRHVRNHPDHMPTEPIRQEWLRDAAKRWAASRLPLLRTPSMVHAVIIAVGRWSTHLDGRSDAGVDPRMLSKDDITSFLAALRVLVNQDKLSPYMHNKKVGFLRQFLSECRDLELDQHRGPLSGLARSVAIAREEIPPSRTQTQTTRSATPSPTPCWPSFSTRRTCRNWPRRPAGGSRSAWRSAGGRANCADSSSTAWPTTSG